MLNRQKLLKQLMPKIIQKLRDVLKPHDLYYNTSHKQKQTTNTSTVILPPKPIRKPPA